MEIKDSINLDFFSQPYPTSIPPLRRSDNLDGIFITAKTYEDAGYGVASDNIAAATIQSVVFDHGVNISFLSDLKAILLNRPYLFFGGKQRLATLYNEVEVFAYNTGSTTLKVQNTITVIPVISNVGLVGVNYKDVVIYPLETVEITRFKKDMNSFLAIQRLMGFIISGTLTEVRDQSLEAVLRRDNVKRSIDYLLKNRLKSNLIWTRVFDAVRNSGNYFSEEEVNMEAISLIIRHWWPIMQSTEYIPSEKTGNLDFVSTPFNIFLTLQKLGKLMREDSKILNITSSEEESQTEEDIENLIKIEKFLNYIFNTLDYIKELKPIPIGIINKATHIEILPGEKMSLVLLP